MMKILLVPGSTRTGSLNEKLAMAAEKTAALAALNVTRISLTDFAMPIYNGDEENRDGQPAAAWELARLFSAHQGIVIVSPEYNAGMPPLLKNTLDWISRIQDPDISPFKKPVFALAAASPGGFGGMRGLMMLRQTLQLGLGALVIPEQMLLPRAGSAFSDDGQLMDEGTANRLDAMLAALLARIPLQAD